MRTSISTNIKNLSIALEALSRVMKSDSEFAAISQLLQEEINAATMENNPIHTFNPAPPPPRAYQADDDIPF